MSGDVQQLLDHRAHIANAIESSFGNTRAALNPDAGTAESLRPVGFAPLRECGVFLAYWTSVH